MLRSMLCDFIIFTWNSIRKIFFHKIWEGNNKKNYFHTLHKIANNESPVDKITLVNYHNKTIKNKENIFLSAKLHTPYHRLY